MTPATMRRVVVACALAVGLATAGASSPGLVIEEVDVTGFPDVEVEVLVPPDLVGASLSKRDFQILERAGDAAGVSFEPETLGGADVTDARAPSIVRTVLAIDVSGSMTDNDAIGDARRAAAEFVRGLPRDAQIGIVTFGDTARTVLPLTDDHDRVLAELDGIRADPAADTALFDGVVEAVGALPRGDVSSSVVLLADGENSAGDGSADAARQAVAASGTELWAIALQTGEADLSTLGSLAGEGTDRLLQVTDLSQLESIYQQVASDLSRRQTLRYASRLDADDEGPVRVAVAVTAGGRRYQTETVVEVDLSALPTDAGPAPEAPAAPLAVDPAPQIVTVPRLGTMTMYRTGLGAIFAAILLAAWVALSPHDRSRRRLLQADGATTRARPKLSTLAEWTTDLADRRLQQGGLGHGIDRALEGAGLDLRPGELVVIVGSMMVVAAGLGWTAGGAVLAVVLALIVPLAVRLALSIRRDRRHAAFADQLTDVLQLIAGSLRAGYGLLQGIDAVARDADEPAASEFHRIIVENRLGRDLSDAMHNCATRMDNADFAWVVQAIGIHREVGGDLATVLDNIVATVRDRADVHRQVRALSAEGRMSAVVLTAMPFVVLLVISLLNPAYVRPLFTTPIGLVLVTGSAVMMLIGTLWVRRLARISY